MPAGQWCALNTNRQTGKHWQTHVQYSTQTKTLWDSVAPSPSSPPLSSFHFLHPLSQRCPQPPPPPPPPSPLLANQIKAAKLSAAAANADVWRRRRDSIGRSSSQKVAVDSKTVMLVCTEECVMGSREEEENENRKRHLQRQWQLCVALQQQQNQQRRWLRYFRGGKNRKKKKRTSRDHQIVKEEWWIVERG